VELIAAAVTVGLGLLGVLAPDKAMRLVGIEAIRPHGGLDVRATYGGLFIALGAFPLLSGEPVAFQMLGAVWLAAGLARAVFTPIDRVWTRENLAGIAVEVGLGLAALLPSI
jgi:hypothetical protein